MELVIVISPNAAQQFALRILQITDNAIIPLKERVADRFYDPLKKFFRIFRSKKQES